MPRIKLALVGLGKITHDQHLPAIRGNENFELVAAASLFGESCGVPTFNDIRSMLSAVPDIEAISICTPPRRGTTSPAMRWIPGDMCCSKNRLPPPSVRRKLWSRTPRAAMSRCSPPGIHGKPRPCHSQKSGCATVSFTASRSLGKRTCACGIRGNCGSARPAGWVMHVNGAPVVVGTNREYPNLYERFETLVRQRDIDVDLAPLRLVADAFLCGRRVSAEPFD